MDFKIISFDCPDCISRDWRSIINVHGKFLQIANFTIQSLTSGTPKNSSLMEFSCPGLVVKQPGFYVVLPIFPHIPNAPATAQPVQVVRKTKSWDRALESKPPATIWFDKGDQINFKTTTENMHRVPGTIIRVLKMFVFSGK